MPVFVVNGCTHGDLDQIYDAILEAEDTRHVQTDFFLSCGDFQAIRTREELDTLACPDKYRHMKDFTKYWSGESKPSCPTIFIGGNHEAPGHLRELYYGGYASENIYYLGHSGVLNISGVRIAGLSGIFKGGDFETGHFETFPYTEDTKRSAYHVKRFEVEKLLLIKEPIDVFISHDWPGGITDYGDVEKLLKIDKTGQLTADIKNKTLGNPFSMALIKKLKPKYWFSGHMHMHFTAIYVHDDGSLTRFMALDKCQPGRQFLHFFELDNKSKELVGEVVHEGGTRTNGRVCLDIEWLSILKLNNGSIPLEKYASHVALVQPSRDDLQAVIKLLREDGQAREIEVGKFEAPFFGRSRPGEKRYREWLCRALQMDDVLAKYEYSLGPQEPLKTVLDDEGLFYIDDFSGGAIGETETVRAEPSVSTEHDTSHPPGAKRPRVDEEIDLDL